MVRLMADCGQKGERDSWVVLRCPRCGHDRFTAVRSWVGSVRFLRLVGHLAFRHEEAATKSESLHAIECGKCSASFGENEIGFSNVE